MEYKILIPLINLLALSILFTEDALIPIYFDFGDEFYFMLLILALNVIYTCLFITFMIVQIVGFVSEKVLLLGFSYMSYNFLFAVRILPMMFTAFLSIFYSNKHNFVYIPATYTIFLILFYFMLSYANFSAYLSAKYIYYAYKEKPENQNNESSLIAPAAAAADEQGNLPLAPNDN